MKKYPALILVVSLLLVFSVIGFAVYRHYCYQPKGALRLRPMATTEKQFSEALLQFHQRTTVDAYIQAGKQSDAWNGDAMRLLDGFARDSAHLPDAPTPRVQAALARSILQKGCSDPLIQYVYAQALCDQQKMDAAIPYLRRAAEGFAKSRYPKVRCVAAPLRLADCLALLAPAKGDEITGMRNLGEQWMAEAMHDGSFRSDETRIVLRVVNDHCRLLHSMASVLSKMEATPGDDSYVLKLLQGGDALDLAVSLRKTGTPDNLRASQERLKEAYRLLHAAWKLRPEYPEAPTRIITIARMDTKTAGSPREWFDRAIAAQCDYEEAYTGMLYSLLPGYGGSYAKMYAFGVECLHTGRYDTIIPSMFYKALYRISADANGGQEYWRKPETRAYLETMFKGYEANASPIDQPHYKSMHAAAAWYYHQYDESMRLLDELGDRVEPEAFSMVYHAEFSLVREEIYTKAAPCGPLIAQAEKLYKGKGAAAGRAEYLRILGRGGWSPYLTGLLNSRIAVLGIEDQFKKDGWVNLLPGPGLAGWKPVDGNWLLDKDGALTGTASEHGLLMLCKWRFPARLELRGEIEFPITATHQLSAGLLLGGRDATIKGEKLSGSSLAFLIDHASGMAILHDVVRRQRAAIKVPVKPQNLLRVICWNGKITTYLNGKPVHVTTQAGSEFTAALLLGVTAEGAPGLALKVRRLQVRRLMEDPREVPVMKTK